MIYNYSQMQKPLPKMWLQMIEGDPEELGTFVIGFLRQGAFLYLQ